MEEIKRFTNTRKTWKNNRFWFSKLNVCICETILINCMNGENLNKKIGNCIHRNGSYLNAGNLKERVRAKKRRTAGKRTIICIRKLQPQLKVKKFRYYVLSSNNVSSNNILSNNFSSKSTEMMFCLMTFGLKNFCLTTCCLTMFGLIFVRALVATARRSRPLVRLG
jgi:hypothetical protein